MLRKGAGLAGEELGFSFGATAGDYNNDGWTDLFIANAGSNTLYQNNRDGTFTDVSRASGLGKPKDTLNVQAAWFDYDHDGRLALFVSNYMLWAPQANRRCVREGRDFSIACAGIQAMGSLKMCQTRQASARLRRKKWA